MSKILGVDLERDEKRIKKINKIIFKHKTINYKQHIKVINGQTYLYHYTQYRGKTKENYNSRYDWQSLGPISKYEYMKYTHNRINRGLAEDLQRVASKLKERMDLLIEMKTEFKHLDDLTQKKLLQKSIRHLQHLDKYYEKSMKTYEKTIERQQKILEAYDELEEKERIKAKKRAI